MGLSPQFFPNAPFEQPPSYEDEEGEDISLSSAYAGAPASCAVQIFSSAPSFEQLPPPPPCREDVSLPLAYTSAPASCAETHKQWVVAAKWLIVALTIAGIATAGAFALQAAVAMGISASAGACGGAGIGLLFCSVVIIPRAAKSHKMHRFTDHNWENIKAFLIESLKRTVIITGLASAIGAFVGSAAAGDMRLGSGGAGCG